MDLLHTPLGELACALPGAIRVLRRHGIDFYCRGHETLQQAAAARGLDGRAIAEEIGQRQHEPCVERDWRGVGNAVLIAHILERYHDVHEHQLPALIAAARGLAARHDAHAGHLAGLAEHLAFMHRDLEQHMLNEEQLLFPRLAQGRFHGIGQTRSAMLAEHEQCAHALERLEAMTGRFTAPAGADDEWRAFYRDLAQFHEDLLLHIHLENNILLAGRAVA